MATTQWNWSFIIVTTINRYFKTTLSTNLTNSMTHQRGPMTEIWWSNGNARLEILLHGYRSRYLITERMIQPLTINIVVVSLTADPSCSEVG